MTHLKSEKVSALVAAEVSATLLDLLKRDVRFEVRYQVCRDEETLLRAVPGSEVLVTRHYNRVTSAVIAAAPSLRLIAQGTSGLDNIAVEEAGRRGIGIVSTPGENANAVAELVLSHMIALTRTVPLYDAMMRQGIWMRDDCATRHELRAHRIGIVGLGRVGSAVARLAGAFGAKSIAYDPYLTADDFATRGAARAQTLDELLAATDILTLHVPLTEETRRMIAVPQLDSLREGSYVINTSRGEVLDIEALFERIDRGRIAGAALDVYDPEPPHPLRPPVAARVILTPHIAGCSHESKASIGVSLYRQICAALGFTPLD
jgi:D-3-phosphoglycerate dehydrogenase